MSRLCVDFSGLSIVSEKFLFIMRAPDFLTAEIRLFDLPLQKRFNINDLSNLYSRACRFLTRLLKSHSDPKNLIFYLSNLAVIRKLRTDLFFKMTKHITRKFWAIGRTFQGPFFFYEKSFVWKFPVTNGQWVRSVYFC